MLLSSLWITQCTAAEKADWRLGKFSDLLQSEGFTVQTGDTKTANPFQWVDNMLMDSCAANNAGQYYKLLPVPLLPEEDVTNKDLAVFMMRPDEAIIYVGPTPPACDYFSFTQMLVTRHKNPIIAKGDWLFASLGDPLNNFLIQTETGAQFAANTIVIFTPDRGIYQTVSAAARQAGYPGSMINLAVIPSSVLNLGISPQSDSLTVQLRTANFVDPNAENDYLNNDNYATLLRITPNYPVTLQPYAWPNPRNREVGPEGGSLNFNYALKAGLERLKAAILAKTPHARSQSYDQSSRWWYDSRDVVQDNPASPAYRQNVAGESSDTTYLRTSGNGVDPDNFTFGKNDMVVVYGVNHTATGLATYNSFGIYGEWLTNVNCIPFYIWGANDPIWNGVAGMTNHDFTGSADYYIPGDPMAPYLYAVRVVRGAIPPGDRYCVSVPEPTKAWWVTPGVPGTSDGIGLDQPMTVGYRAYVNPITKSGPSYNDIIPDRAIWFGKPSVQSPLDLLLMTD